MRERQPIKRALPPLSCNNIGICLVLMGIPFPSHLTGKSRVEFSSPCSGHPSAFRECELKSKSDPKSRKILSKDHVSGMSSEQVLPPPLTQCGVGVEGTGTGKTDATKTTGMRGTHRGIEKDLKTLQEQSILHALLRVGVEGRLGPRSSIRASLAHLEARWCCGGLDR